MIARQRCSSIASARRGEHDARPGRSVHPTIICIRKRPVASFLQRTRFFALLIPAGVVGYAIAHGT
jgi:hypothetical protein